MEWCTSGTSYPLEDLRRKQQSTMPSYDDALAFLSKANAVDGGSIYETVTKTLAKVYLDTIASSYVLACQQGNA